MITSLPQELLDRIYDQRKYPPPGPRTPFWLTGAAMEGSKLWDGQVATKRRGLYGGWTITPPTVNYELGGIFCEGKPRDTAQPGGVLNAAMLPTGYTSIPVTGGELYVKCTRSDNSNPGAVEGTDYTYTCEYTQNGELATANTECIQISTLDYVESPDPEGIEAGNPNATWMAPIWKPLFLGVSINFVFRGRQQRWRWGRVAWETGAGSSGGSAPPELRQYREEYNAALSDWREYTGQGSEGGLPQSPVTIFSATVLP